MGGCERVAQQIPERQVDCAQRADLGAAGDLEIDGLVEVVSRCVRCRRGSWPRSSGSEGASAASPLRRRCADRSRRDPSRRHRCGASTTSSGARRELVVARIPASVSSAVMRIAGAPAQAFFRATSGATSSGRNVRRECMPAFLRLARRRHQTRVSTGPPRRAPRSRSSPKHEPRAAP